jgi:hypothetical protein
MNKMITRDRLIDVLLETLERHFNEMNEVVDLSSKENVKLFGGDGLLDSIGLVSYIVEVEENLQEVFGVSIILADEKAMSKRTSPFARISYLADYILEAISSESYE